MVGCNIMIFTEDTYGRDFIKGLVSRLKIEGLIKSEIGVNVRRLAGICNSKMQRQIKAAAITHEKIIVIADADGKPIQEIRKRILYHVPPDLQKIVRTIILRYEIEEWICISLGLHITKKPSIELDEYIKKKEKDAKSGYKKYMLPKFVETLNINRLENYNSFKEFINALSC